MGTRCVTLAVADTGPLIHLDEIDARHVLSIIDHVLLPQTVYDELAAGTVPPALGDIEYDRVEADAAALEVELAPGETAALAVAADRSAVFLTADLAARNAAAERGVEVHGSIGILVLASSRGEPQSIGGDRPHASALGGDELVYHGRGREARECAARGVVLTVVARDPIERVRWGFDRAPPVWLSSRCARRSLLARHSHRDARLRWDAMRSGEHERRHTIAPVRSSRIAPWTASNCPTSADSGRRQSARSHVRCAAGCSVDHRTGPTSTGHPRAIRSLLTPDYRWHSQSYEQVRRPLRRRRTG